MDKYAKITPQGSRDYLFEESDDMRKIESTLTSFFKENSYHPVTTGAVEYLDVFKNGTFADDDEMYKFEDKSGKTTVLRPDNTLPIARLVATRLEESDLPVRLFYDQNIYLKNNRDDGSTHEITQSGIELIGEPGLSADTEVIAMAVKALGMVGLSNYKIEIGHAAFLKAVLNNMEASPSVKAEICRLIENREYSALNDLLDGMGSSPETAVLHRIPRLFGGIEVLSEARELYSSPQSNEALKYIKTLYEKLCEMGLGENIIIDLGFVNRNDYYTGVIFRGYAEGSGTTVLSGGRYDTLLSKFGMDAPAIGFAFDVNLLCDVMHETVNIERPLRIALTKGRLEKCATELFKTMGLDTKELEKKGRRLILPVDNYEAVLSKASDVITYVEHGVCDIGIVGKDIILEDKGSFYEVLDLNVGKCKFALAAPKGSDFMGGHKRKTVASKYPNVAREYFESHGMDVNIIKISGSVELAPLLGLADGIVDIVETGATLRENGLEIVDEIMPVSARVIVNMASMKLRKAEIEDFLRDIEIASHV